MTSEPKPSDDNIPPEEQETVIGPVESDSVSESSSDSSGDILPARKTRVAHDGQNAFDPTLKSNWPQIDGYIIDDYLGGGGFGYVFKAKSTLHGGHVAIKILKPKYSADHQAIARFEREIHAAHTNRSGHIVQLLTSGICENAPYENAHFLVTEFLSGGDLNRWLHNNPIESHANLRDAVSKIVSVCRGLSTLHSSGVIHRDIKPANVILTAQGEAKVADFGLAAFLDRKGVTGEQLTVTGQLVGSLPYMAPEQILDARKVTPQSDQYAVGVILYQLLCSLRPWQTTSRDQEEEERILSNLSFRPDPPRSKSRSADKTLQAICLRCLDPEPTFRYSNIDQLRESLEAWIAGEPDPHAKGWLKRTFFNKVLRPVRRRPFRFTFTVAAALSIAAVSYTLWNRIEYVKQLEARDEVISGQNRELITSNANLEDALAKRERALSLEQAARQEAIGKDLAQRSARELQPGGNPETALKLAVQAVGVVRPPNFETLEMLSAASQATQTVSTISDYQTASWSPQGDLLLCGPRFVTEFDPKYFRALMTPAGETVRRFGYGGVDYGIGKVFWSPRGDFFVVTSSRKERIEVIDAAGTLIWSMQEESRSSKEVAWAPDGDHFVRPGESEFQLFDLTNIAKDSDLSPQEENGLFLGWITDDSYVTKGTTGAIYVRTVSGDAELAHAPIDCRELKLHSFDGQHVLIGTCFVEGAMKALVIPLRDMDSSVSCSLTETFDEIIWADNSSVFVLFNKGAWRTFTYTGVPLSPEIKAEKKITDVKISPIGTSLIVIYESSPSADLFEINGEPLTPVQHFGGQLTISHARNWPRPLVGYTLSGKPVLQPTTPGDFVTDCIWSPSGQAFASIGTRASALWESGGFPITNLDNGQRFASAIKWSPQGSKLLCFFELGVAMQVRSPEGTPLGVIRGVEPYAAYVDDEGATIKWSPDDNLICVEGSWRTADRRSVDGVKVYESLSQPASILSGHFEADNRGVLSCLAWAPDSNRLATGVRYATGLSSTIAGRRERRLSRTLSLYLEDAEHIGNLDIPRFLERVNELSWRSDGQLLAVAYEDSQFSSDADCGGIVLMDQQGRIVQRLIGAEEFAWQPDKKSGVCRVASTLKVINADGDITDNITLPELSHYRWSPDGSLLALNFGGKVKLYSHFEGKLREEAHPPLNGKRIVDWSANSQFLFLAQEIGEYRGVDPHVSQVVSTPVVCDIKRVDIHRWENTRSITIPEYVSEIAISPDGTYVACGNATNNDSPADIYVWEVDSSLLTRRKAHVGLRRLAWQPGDETYLFASAGDDGWVCLWDAKSGLMTVADDTSDISSPVVELAWSRGGTFLATADTTNSVRVWDAHGRKVVSYSQADGPFAIPQMGNSVKPGRQHKEILSQDFFHLEWSHDNRWLVVCNNSPEARVFFFDFPALYRRATERLSIDEIRTASRNLRRSWNPLSDDWELAGAPRDIDTNEGVVTRLVAVCSEIEELLQANHLDAADRLISEELKKLPRTWQLWDLRAQLERRRRSPIREYQSLMLARQLGGKNEASINRMIELATDLDWASEKMRLLEEPGHQTPIARVKSLLPDVLNRLGIEGGSTVSYFAQQRDVPLGSASTEDLAQALSLLNQIESLPGQQVKPFSKGELSLLNAFIAEAYAGRLQRQREFVEAASLFEVASDAYLKHKLSSFVIERAQRHLRFCRACNEVKDAASQSDIDGALKVVKFVRLIEAITESRLPDAADRCIELAQEVTSSDATSRMGLLKAAVVMATFIDGSNDSEKILLAKLLQEMVVEFANSDRPEKDPEYAAFGIGDIGPDPANGYGAEEKSIAFVLQRLETFLDVTTALHLIDRLGHELSLEVSTRLLLTLLEKHSASSQLTASDVQSACESRMLTAAFRLTPKEGGTHNEDSLLLADRCYTWLQNHHGREAVKPISVFISLERARIAMLIGDRDKEVLNLLSNVFGPNPVDAQSPIKIDFDQRESQYEDVFASNDTLYRQRSFWAYSILWLRTLRAVGEGQRFDQQLFEIRAALDERCKMEKVDYEVLDLAVQAAMMQIERDSESNRDISKLIEHVLLLTRQAKKVVPGNSTLGGVPTPGFAGYSNPTALEHTLLIEIGEDCLLNSKLVAAEAIADAVIKFHEQSNWHVRDYLAAYLDALRLKVRVLLNKPAPSWIERSEALTTTLRLIRNDGVTGKEQSQLLDRAVKLCNDQARVADNETLIDMKSPVDQLGSDYEFEIRLDTNLRIVAFKTDVQGRRISELCFNADGQPAELSNGSHGWTQEFIGNEVIRSYMDASKVSVDTDDGYAIVRRLVDGRGRQLSETYFNTAYQPTLCSDGFHGWNVDLDSDGREVSRQYIGVEGEELFASGVRIKEVLSDSNAERSGLAAMDSIVSYHGQHPQTFDELVKLIEGVDEDESIDTVEVVVERGGERVTLQVEKGKLGAAIATQYGPRPDTGVPEFEDSKALE